MTTGREATAATSIEVARWLRLHGAGVESVLVSPTSGVRLTCSLDGHEIVTDEFTVGTLVERLHAARAQLNERVVARRAPGWTPDATPARVRDALSRGGSGQDR